MMWEMAKAKQARLKSVQKGGGKGISFEIAVVLEPDEGGFLVYVPALSGCLSWGATREEALQSIREAAALYIESLIDHGEPIPIGRHEPSQRRGTYIVRVYAGKEDRALG